MFVLLVAADAGRNPVLDALSYGRAVAETLNQRLAATMSPENILAELEKANAEITQALRSAVRGWAEPQLMAAVLAQAAWLGCSYCNRQPGGPSSCGARARPWARTVNRVCLPSRLHVPLAQKHCLATGWQGFPRGGGGAGAARSKPGDFWAAPLLAGTRRQREQQQKAESFLASQRAAGAGASGPCGQC
jgi:hypothetical protein